MLRASKINYSFYDLASLYIIRKNIEDEIATYQAFINEPGYKEALAASKVELSAIQQAITEVSKQTPKKKAEVILAPAEQKSADVVYYNPTSRKVRAKPICSFTEDQIELMRRYIEGGADLDDAAVKPLIEATIYDDEIYMDYNFTPVLIITEGQIYKSQALDDYYKIDHPYIDQNDITRTPHPHFKKTPKLDFPCTKDDIIPCNTLLRALQLLLAKAERWERNDKREPSVPELKQPAVKRKYTELTEKEVEILEIIYKCLSPSRQLMFNVIVRSEDEIMNKAVILPDGFVYDASIAEKQLKLVSPKGKFPAEYEGSCPSNPGIIFKVVRDKEGKDIYSEIKPALYYDKVIKILQKNAAYFQEVVKVEGMKALSDPELSEERDGAIFKLSKYLEKVEKAPVMKTDDDQEKENLVAIKDNQVKVIQAAIHALQFVDHAKFQAVTRECSKVPEQSYDAVKTKFNGINSGKGFFSKVYRAGAYLTGTIQGQFGVEMPTIVSRVNALLLRCTHNLEQQQNHGRKFN